MESSSDEEKRMAFLNDGSIHLGYNDAPWTFSYDVNDVYTFTADPVRRRVGRLRAEAKIAAQEIAAAYDGYPIYVLYSGGIDSEAILCAFLDAAIPITAVCVRFEDDLNQHDLEYAYKYFDQTKFLEKNNQIKIVDVNIRDWLKSSSCLEIAREVQTIELGYTHLFKTILEDLQDGVSIIGQDEPLVFREDQPSGSEWIFNSHERHYSLHKFFLRYQQRGIPSFFQWSVELHNSFMHNDVWIALINNMYNPSIWSTDFVKYTMYYREMGLLSRKKYTGFERLLSEILITNKKWKDTLPFKWQRSRNINVFKWFRNCEMRSIHDH
jgi:hypothetical protein